MALIVALVVALVVELSRYVRPVSLTALGEASGYAASFSSLGARALTIVGRGHMTRKYTLYGGAISYYSAKARAYLNYKGIDYEELAATRAIYKTIILPKVGWPVIPVVVTPAGETLQDTSDIIDALENEFPEAPVLPATPKQKVVALLLEVFGDEWLKLPAMHYRWNHNTEWIIREFGRLSAPELDEAGQREVGERTCRPFRGSLPMLGVVEETYAAVESSYEGLLRELDAHFSEHQFLLGSRPSIGDFGLVGPLYAHQYRDPYSGDLMRRIAPNVAAWVLRTMEPAARSGEFLADDQIPLTLLPVLQRMMREQIPTLHDTMVAVGEWARDNPQQTELPRGIGMHSFTLEAGLPNEVTAERAILPFQQWMWQRPLDAFNALDAAAQSEVNNLLAQAGGADAFVPQPQVRLARENFQLVVKR